MGKNISKIFEMDIAIIRLYIQEKYIKYAIKRTRPKGCARFLLFYNYMYKKIVNCHLRRPKALT